MRATFPRRYAQELVETLPVANVYPSVSDTAFFILLRMTLNRNDLDYTHSPDAQCHVARVLLMINLHRS